MAYLFLGGLFVYFRIPNDYYNSSLLIANWYENGLIISSYWDNLEINEFFKRFVLIFNISCTMTLDDGICNLSFSNWVMKSFCYYIKSFHSSNYFP